jgi:AcrR family transcriptional regulator
MSEQQQIPRPPSRPGGSDRPAVVDRRRPRAPRNSLSAELIVDTALRLLDAHGMESFSMRALAEELRVGTMALYTYFRGKDELFTAARERALTQHLPPPRTGEPWDQQLRTACIALYELFTCRPSVLQLLAEHRRRSAEEGADPQLADGAVSAVEHMLSLLRTAGLSCEEAARAQTALLHYTVGAALKTSSAGVCRADPDVRGRLRTRLEALPADVYPSIVALAPELAAAQDGTAQYTFGLDLLLAGLRDLTAVRATGRPPHGN